MSNIRSKIEETRILSQTNSLLLKQVLRNKSDKTGWITSAPVTLSFVNGTRTFTITPTGSTFEYWIQGQKFIKSAAESVVITDTEGVWYIYYVLGTLTASQTEWDISAGDKAMISRIFWDATNNIEIGIAYELHGYLMHPSTHGYAHDTIGTRYEDGLAISLGAGGDLGKVGYTGGELHDEDNEISITDGAGGSLFEQVLTLPAQIPVFYRSGTAAWRKYAAGDYPFYDNAGGDNIHYNLDTAGSWSSQAASGANKYIAMWIYGTNEQNEPVIAIMGQNESNTVALARTDNTLDGLSFGTLPFAEMKILHRLILRTDGGTIESLDLRATSNLPGGTFVPTSHGSLSGLGNDDHTLYLLADGTRAVTGALTIQGLLTVDSIVPEGDLADSLGTAALTWLDLFVQDIKDAAGNTILSNDGAGKIDALGNITSAVTMESTLTIQGLLTADGVVPEADLSDTLGTATLTWLDLFVQDIKDAAGNVILSNDGAGNIDAIAPFSANITFTAAQTVDGVDISALSITNMPTAVNNWMMYCTNGTGVMTELATGAANTILIGNGVGAAPSFQVQPAPIAHVHDGDTLQLDGINSDGGAFSFTTSGAITFNQNLAFTGAQTVDGKDVSTLGTDAEAHAYVEANALTITGGLQMSGVNITMAGAETVDGVDISAISITSMPTAVNNWKMYCTNGAGVMTELATGGASTLLTGNGVGAAPSFQTQTHNGDTLLFDGINSDGGAFAFATTGSLSVDMVNAGATIFSITNSGAGVASLDITGDITVSGTVDGVDIAARDHAPTVAGDLNHNDLANIDAGDINHLTDAQVAALHAAAHTHDTDTLQLDGINSDGGAFSFTTSGAITFNQNLDFTGAQTVDGKDVSTLGTAAEGLALVNATGLAIATTKLLAFDDGGSANIIRDQDDMAADDANALATQQSIKAFVEVRDMIGSANSALIPCTFQANSAGEAMDHSTGYLVQTTATDAWWLYRLPLPTNAMGLKLYVKDVVLELENGGIGTNYVDNMNLSGVDFDTADVLLNDAANKEAAGSHTYTNAAADDASSYKEVEVDILVRMNAVGGLHVRGITVECYYDT